MDPNAPPRRRYVSDLSDTAWARIAHFMISKHPRCGRPCPPQRWREYLNTILYVMRTGCAWRHLPHDFAVSWSAAHKHFLRCCHAGTPPQAGGTPGPRCSPRCGRLIAAEGVPGHRPAGGPTARRKSTASIATFWLTPLASSLPRSSPGRHAGPGRVPGPAAHTQRIPPTVGHHWVDRGYTSQTACTASAKAGASVNVVSARKPSHRFIVQPRRWVVEHTNDWINHCRRLDRHYKVTLDTHEGFLILGQIALLLRRHDRRQLFDTL